MKRVLVAVLVSVVLCVVAIACSSSSSTPTPPEPTPTPPTPTPPDPNTPPTPTPPTPTPPTPTPPTPTGNNDTPPAAACGDEEAGQPMCPLQAWMTQNMKKAVDDHDVAALGVALRTSAAFAPDPQWNEGENGWRTIGEAAAAKAEAGDFNGARASCKSCHRAWRERYQTEFRTRPVPGAVNTPTPNAPSPNAPPPSGGPPGARSGAPTGPAGFSGLGTVGTGRAGS